MADPISLTASIVAIIGVCRTSAKFVIRFAEGVHNAPKELIATSNEVNDLNVILCQVDKAYQNDYVPPNTSRDQELEAALTGQLTQAQVLLSDLDTLVKTCSKVSADDKITVDRIGWQRKRRTVDKIRSRLKTTQRNIHMLISLTTASVSQKAIVAVQKVHVDVLLQQQQDQQIVESSHVQTITSQTAIGGQEKSVQLDQLAAVELPANYQPSLQDPSISLHERQVEPFERLNPESHEDSRASPAEQIQAWQTRDYTSLHLQWRTLDKCWLFAAAIRVAAGATEVPMSLFVQRRVDGLEENGIMDLIRKDDLEGVKKLFMKRLAAPSDADRKGHTTLHEAVLAGRIAIVDLILQFGADPDLEEDTGESVFQTVWSKIFENPHSSRKCRPDEIKALKRMFPETQSIERFCFSDMHKAVLRILPIDLESFLSQEMLRAQANHRDAWDRTPLHWAANAGDERTVESLIRIGADVNVQDYMKTTPAHYAARANHVRGLELLLIAKANPRSRNWVGEEPVHYACWKSVAHLETLLLAGASLYPGTGGDLVTWSVFCDRAAITQFLIDKGLDRDFVDPDGTTPLLKAVSNLAYECLTVLLAASVNIHYVHRSGATILHWTACWGDNRIVEILSRSQIRGLDIQAIDSKGRTPMQVLESRPNRPAGFDEYFARLLAGIAAANIEDSDSEVYLDADEGLH
ncbi:MAG: hypothetical protein Q9175_007808 [Cornicularia normoerica]